MLASPCPSSCDKDDARAPGFCSFLSMKPCTFTPLLELALTAPPPAASTRLVRVSKGEMRKERGGTIFKTNKTTPDSGNYSGGVHSSQKAVLPVRANHSDSCGANRSPPDRPSWNTVGGCVCWGGGGGLHIPACSTAGPAGRNSGLGPGPSLSALYWGAWRLKSLWCPRGRRRE